MLKLKAIIAKCLEGIAEAKEQKNGVSYKITFPKPSWLGSKSEKPF
jgi:hypothetical protein